jgi:membrane associated rhomboid family serine protease
MVIIPTEKRFDWNHAPVVLFSIVLINILIFFIYQSGDGKKFESALQAYQKEKFLEIEWPFFKKYLNEKNDTKALNRYQSLYNEQRFDEISFNIILNQDFYRYLRIDQYEYFQLGDVGDWFAVREQINDNIASTSISSFGLTPSSIKVFHFLSYQFLHGDMMHLLGNLFFLVICGFAVEAAIGRWRFLLFYLICGIAGGALHVIFNLKETIPLVGASGSISGVMAMYLGLFRLKKIEFFYWLFIFVGYFRAPALLILFFYIGKELFQFYGGGESNVAFLAHTGGFIAGAIIMGIAYYLNPKIFNQSYIEEDQSIDPIQEKMSTIYEFIGKYQFEAAEKALSRTIEEYGLTFELAFIRYNLSKIRKDEKHYHQMVELMTTETDSDNEIEKIERIWKENRNNLESLNHETMIKIGLTLAKLKIPESAAEICDLLVEKESKNKKLVALAKEVANKFAGLSHPLKQRKYTAVAEKLLAENTQ